MSFNERAREELAELERILWDSEPPGTGGSGRINAYTRWKQKTAKKIIAAGYRKQES